MNAVGQCITAFDHYDPLRDFRYAEASDSSSEPRLAPLQFRASYATYCAVDDKLCAKCRISVFPRLASNATVSGVDGIDPLTATTAFCYGMGDCVCIAACESTSWSENVGGTKCPSGSIYSSRAYYHKETGMKTWEITVIVTVAVLAVVAVASALVRRRKRVDGTPVWLVDTVFKRCRRAAPEQTALQGSTEREEGGEVGTGSAATTTTTRAATGGPKREGLSLFGWRVMREELIENETHRLARLDEERSPHADFLQFADTAPSAPSFDDDVSGSGAAHASKPSAPSHEP